MHFADVPRPETNLMPGMYKLNEEVVCRRRNAGNLPWHWNVGIVSPAIPPMSTACASAQ
jgi:para-nitrobenzyl esterase